MGSADDRARFVLERKLGRPIAADLMALHTCDTPNCVAEGHLYEGTAKNNVWDAVTRDRWNAPAGDDHYTRRCPELAPRGERNGMSTLNETTVRAIRAAVEAGETKTSVAKRFEVSRRAIGMIVSGQRWKHVL